MQYIGVENSTGMSLFLGSLRKVSYEIWHERDDITERYLRYMTHITHSHYFKIYIDCNTVQSPVHPLELKISSITLLSVENAVKAAA